MISENWERKLGKRASAWIDDAILSRHGGRVYLRDTADMPRGVERTMRRLFGRPEPGGYMSEEAYYDITDAIESEVML